MISRNALGLLSLCASSLLACSNDDAFIASSPDASITPDASLPVASLVLTLELPGPGTVVTTAEGSFEAYGAFIAFSATDPGNTSERVWSEFDSLGANELAAWNPPTDTIEVRADRFQSMPSDLYVLVRLCATVQQCRNSSFSASTQRDFLWKVQHPYYAERQTRITLPIPSGPPIDPDTTAGFTQGLESQFGCVLDDWQYALATPPAANGEPRRVEINRCFVYSPTCRDGIMWGCDSDIAQGSPLACDLEQASATHYCDEQNAPTDDH